MKSRLKLGLRLGLRWALTKAVEGLDSGLGLHGDEAVEGAHGEGELAADNASEDQANGSDAELAVEGGEVGIPEELLRLVDAPHAERHAHGCKKPVGSQQSTIFAG